MRVEIIPCLKDNFSYLIIDDNNNSACVVDPSEAEPIINFLKNKNINLKYILNTHHHFDHIGGNKDLRYAAEFITSRDKNVTLMIGVDTGVYHGFVNCGASGAITGIGNALPKEVLLLTKLCQEAAIGNAISRRQAQELDAALAVLSSFDEGPDLVLYYKYLMVLNGELEYELHFNETDFLSASQKHYIEKQYQLFKTFILQE